MKTKGKKFGSVCSGIEAAAVAWGRLGWSARFVSEIEPFPCEVLASRWPEVPNLGDMTAPDFYDRARALGDIDVLVGGTPCQAFSFAGTRKSLGDDRGYITLTYTRLAHELNPRWIVWENVRGVLSTPDNAFGCFLAKLVGAKRPLVSWLDRGRWPGAGMVIGPRRSAAWRILNSIYFGVAQTRRRVFVVSGRTGDGTNPGAVLFEPESLRRNPAADREAGTRNPGDPARGPGGEGVPYGLNAADSDLIPHRDHSPTIRDRSAPAVIAMASGVGGAEVMFDKCPTITCNHSVPIVSMATGQGSAEITFDAAATLNCNHEAPIIALAGTAPGAEYGVDYAPTLLASGEASNARNKMIVRRLTPMECERLQGFPDGHTAIRLSSGKQAPDAPRYKALGNSMAVPVMQWIGNRIDLVDAAIASRRATV